MCRLTVCVSGKEGGTGRRGEIEDIWIKQSGSTLELGTYTSQSKTIISTGERNWLLREWLLPPLRLEGKWVNVCKAVEPRRNVGDSVS